MQRWVGEVGSGPRAPNRICVVLGRLRTTTVGNEKMYIKVISTEAHSPLIRTMKGSSLLTSDSVHQPQGAGGFSRAEKATLAVEHSVCRSVAMGASQSLAAYMQMLLASHIFCQEFLS